MLAIGICYFQTVPIVETYFKSEQMEILILYKIKSYVKLLKINKIQAV